jgi:hypothetical protein
MQISRRLGLSALLCLGLLGSALPAVAEAPAPMPASMLVEPARLPGFHMHDGFYLRLGTGFGSYSEAIRQRGADQQTTVTGVASVSEFGIGGAVRPGLVFGGGVWSSTVLASARTVKGATPPGEVVDGRAEFSLVGPFFDYYVDPSRGLHIQSAFGLANVRGINLESASVDDDAVSVGAGLMFGVGYDWWVSDNWSIGVLGRVAVGVTGQKDRYGERWFHAVGGTPSVLFTGTYN